MFEIMDLLLARVTTLTEDLLFDHKPTSTTRAPNVINTFLEQKDSNWKEGQDHPLVRVAIYKGSFDIRPDHVNAVIIGSIWTSGDVTDGTRDIQKLAKALGKIVEQRGFPPFKMVTPVDYFFGDQQAGHEGLQPHPYHYVTLYPKFILP